MDAVTTREEVAQSIAKETSTAKEEIRVGELRPFYGGSQAATVSMPEAAAEKILKKGEVRVAYNWCRVTRRVNLLLCYKCWGYGHVAAECAAEIQHGKDCRKCGQNGHLMKECKNERHCPLCEKEGHSAGTGACPVMRRALGKARREAEIRQKENIVKSTEDEAMAVEEGTVAVAAVIDPTRTSKEQI